MRFLVKELGARALFLTELLVQLDHARGGVSLGARGRFDIAFERRDFVGDRDTQFPIDPVHEQIGLRKLDLSQNLIHSWIYTGDLRLRLKAENDEDDTFKSLDLVIQTTGEPDGGDWEGTYILDVFDSASPEAPVNAKGKAMCSVE